MEEYMSVDTTEAPASTGDSALVELFKTMPEEAAHEFVGLLMDVEAGARGTEVEFEVQHKETALETVTATAEAYPEVVLTVLDELVYQIAVAELLNALGI
jgi:hypothetical protein